MPDGHLSQFKTRTCHNLHWSKAAWDIISLESFSASRKIYWQICIHCPENGSAPNINSWKGMHGLLNSPGWRRGLVGIKCQGIYLPLLFCYRQRLKHAISWKSLAATHIKQADLLRFPNSNALQIAFCRTVEGEEGFLEESLDLVWIWQICTGLGFSARDTDWGKGLSSQSWISLNSSWSGCFWKGRHHVRGLHRRRGELGSSYLASPCTSCIHPKQRQCIGSQRQSRHYTRRISSWHEAQYRAVMTASTRCAGAITSKLARWIPVKGSVIPPDRNQAVRYASS